MKIVLRCMGLVNYGLRHAIRIVTMGLEAIVDYTIVFLHHNRRHRGGRTIHVFLR